MSTLQFINISPEDLINQIIEKVKANTPVAETQDLMNVSEAIDFLKASRTTLDLLVRKGIITRYKLGQSTYFKKSDIINALIPEKIKVS
jgi:hypothetical protein